MKTGDSALPWIRNKETAMRMICKAIGRLIRALAGLVLFPLLLVIPRKRMMRIALDVLYLTMILPVSERLRDDGRLSGWLENRERDGWIPVSISSDDKGIYLRQWVEEGQGSSRGVVSRLARACSILDVLEDTAQRRELRSDLYVMF